MAGACVGVDAMAEVMKSEAVKEVKVDPPKRFHKIYRFIRHGVDRIMEEQGRKASNLKSHDDKGYGRVSYFTASRIERPKKALSQLQSKHIPAACGSFRHVDYFITSGVAKGEGHLGGGTVADILNIGYSPMPQFKEVRVKRQHKPNEPRLEKFDGIAWNKKLHPLNRKTSACKHYCMYVLNAFPLHRSTEIMRIKRQKKAAAMEMHASRELKTKEREEMEKERKQVKVADNYNRQFSLFCCMHRRTMTT